MQHWNNTQTLVYPGTQTNLSAARVWATEQRNAFIQKCWEVTKWTPWKQKVSKMLLGIKTMNHLNLKCEHFSLFWMAFSHLKPSHGCRNLYIYIFLIYRLLVWITFLSFLELTALITIHFPCMKKRFTNKEKSNSFRSTWKVSKVFNSPDQFISTCGCYGLLCLPLIIFAQNVFR